jgi:predicted DNA-binding WGR domain protein
LEPGAPAIPPATAASTVKASGATRRFEFIDGGSAKFWEVARDGCEVTVRNGRIGTAGQAKAKTLADEAAALSDLEGLVQEKTGKGYAEV